MENQNSTPQSSKSLNYLLIALFVVIVLVIACGAYYFFVFAKPASTNSTQATYTQAEQGLNLTRPTTTSLPTPTLAIAPVTINFKLQTNVHILFVNAWFNTQDPKNGVQEAKIYARSGINIVSMSAVVETDKLKKTYPMSLDSGTAQDGSWKGSWTLGDTYSTKYKITFVAKDANNNSNSYSVEFR